MSEEERLLKFENKLNFGIETRDGTFYVSKDDAVKAVSELLDELPQPQLTIPKSIADEVEDNGLDSYSIHSSLPKDSYLIPEWEPLVDLSEKLMKWCEETEKWWAILDAYLAGKALGVDLVKVVEG